MVEWTDPMVDVLRTQWKEGLSAAQIAPTIAEMAGCRVTRNAVIGKIHRLGIGAEKPHKASTGKRWRSGEAKLPPRRTGPATRPARQWKYTDPFKRPAMPLLKAKEEPPPVGGVSLLDLQDNQCRWIIGDGKYCGGEGYPYCAEHAKQSYVLPSSKKREYIPFRKR